MSGRISGAVVLIYCMAARKEPGWNVSVSDASLRNKHLRCPETPKRSIRKGFQPDVVYTWRKIVTPPIQSCINLLRAYRCLRQRAGLFWAPPALPAALPSCAAANGKPSWGRRGHGRVLNFPQSPGGSSHKSPFIHLLLTAVNWRNLCEFINSTKCDLKELL